MKAWLISVVGACLLVILLELLLSEGKTKKYIQGIIRLFLIIILLTPIIKLLQTDFTDNILENVTIEYDSTQYNKLNKLIKEQTEKEIKSELDALGGKCNVEIILEEEECKYIKIIIEENGINSDGENIYTNEKIIQLVNKIIRIDSEKIYIYGT